MVITSPVAAVPTPVMIPAAAAVATPTTIMIAMVHLLDVRAHVLSGRHCGLQDCAAGKQSQSQPDLCQCAFYHGNLL
jgi:hypothetical protein